MAIVELGTFTCQIIVWRAPLIWYNQSASLYLWQKREQQAEMPPYPPVSEDDKRRVQSLIAVRGCGLPAVWTA